MHIHMCVCVCAHVRGVRIHLLPNLSAIGACWLVHRSVRRNSDNEPAYARAQHGVTLTVRIACALRLQVHARVTRTTAVDEVEVRARARMCSE